MGSAISMVFRLLGWAQHSLSCHLGFICYDFMVLDLGLLCYIMVSHRDLAVNISVYFSIYITTTTTLNTICSCSQCILFVVMT